MNEQIFPSNLPFKEHNGSFIESGVEKTLEASSIFRQIPLFKSSSASSNKTICEIALPNIRHLKRFEMFSFDVKFLMQ